MAKELDKKSNFPDRMDWDRTAWNLDHRKEDFQNNTEFIYLAKAFLDEAALTIIRNVDEIHGGMGTNNEMLTEKLLRDAFTMLHGLNTRSIAYLRGASTREGVSISGLQEGTGIAIREFLRT